MTERPLWAPWRSTYVGGARDRSCFLCAAAARDQEHSPLLLALLPEALAMLNAFPYSPGHVLISPRRHVADILEVSRSETEQAMTLLRSTLEAERQLMAPAGFNIGVNLGTVAGAGVADHLHIHVVPRWTGDTNFMPVLAGARVISQALADTADALRPLLNERLAAEMTSPAAQADVES